VNKLLILFFSLAIVSCDSVPLKGKNPDQEITHRQTIEIDKEGCVKYKIDDEISIKAVIYEQQSGEYTTNKKDSICR